MTCAAVGCLDNTTDPGWCYRCGQAVPAVHHARARLTRAIAEHTRQPWWKAAQAELRRVLGVTG